MSENTEKNSISDEVIAICAINAALKTAGVVRMAGGFSDAFKKNILGKEQVAKGTRVVQDDGNVEIDVHVIARYGYKIPQMAWDIQENVKKEISTMTGLNVTAVNIHVQGVENDDKK